MIRVLTNADHASAYDFCAQNPVFNLYLLGNLESLGLESDICQFWGSFDEQNQLNGVLNRYMDGWSIADGPGCDYEGFGRILDSHPAGAARLQDNLQHIPSLLPYLMRFGAVQEIIQQLCDLSPRDFHPIVASSQLPLAQAWRVRRATLADFDALCALYAGAGDMARTPRGVERPLLSGRVFVAEAGDEIVSSVLTNAETRSAAMIGGVYTAPRHRGRGYATAAMIALCHSLLDDTLHPVLYYHDPTAGAIYHRLGFRHAGLWRSVRLERLALLTPHYPP